jgi:hypothetical protein
VSLDGKQVVYVRNFMHILKDKPRSHLWIVHVDGLKHRPITSGDSNASSPRSSQGVKWLRYISDAGGSGQLRCRWMDTGQTTQLTRLASRSHLLVMRQPATVQGGIHKRCSVLMGGTSWRGKAYPVSPALRGFRMNAAQDHPSLAHRFFHNRWGSVRILANNQAPTGKLGSVFPVMFDNRHFSAGDGYRRPVNTAIDRLVKAKLYA